jgi:hypothetical protein
MAEDEDGIFCPHGWRQDVVEFRPAVDEGLPVFVAVAEVAAVAVAYGYQTSATRIVTNGGADLFVLGTPREVADALRFCVGRRVAFEVDVRREAMQAFRAGLTGEPPVTDPREEAPEQ